MSRTSPSQRAARLRIVVVVALVAGSLANAMVAPARTIRVPETLMRSVTFDGARGSVALSFRPTHVGFTWEGSHGVRVLYRTIDETGPSSRWRIAPVSHDMETGSTRFSGLIEVDRPVNVEYRKRLGAKEDAWMGPVTMESFNTLDGPAREVSLQASTASDSTAPDIVTRAEWGANESLKRTKGGCKRTFHPLRQLFVHHTAGSNFDYDGAATMRAIYAYHTKSRGWCDIGYNFVIDWSGTIFEGRWARNYAPWEIHDSEDYRNYAVAGAHVAGFNSGSVGISLMGNFTGIGPPSQMKGSLKELLAWEADRHGLNPTGSHTFNGRWMKVIAGHRDAGFTACPGNKLYDQLPKLRRKTKTKVGSGRTATELSLDTTAEKIRYGDAVTAFGNLVDAEGQPLPDRTVTLFRKKGVGRWKQHSTVQTGQDGEWARSLTPGKKTKLAATFATHPGYWGSDSRPALVRVKHAVTLAPNDRAPDLEGVYHYGPKEKRVAVGGEVGPPHPTKSVRLRLFKRRTKTSGYKKVSEVYATLDSAGRYFLSFLLPNRTSGTRYKVTGKMAKDRVHETGYSGPSYLIVD
ncbi:MAG: peptidoglycan recognition protein family protein [Actinomycetota bacterium]